MDDTIQTDSQKDKSLVVEPCRLDVIQGPTGRRRWSLREKSRIVAESYNGNVSVSEVARRNGVRPNLLFLWRRQAREGKLVLAAEVMDVGFVPALVEPEPAGSAMLEIEVDGVVVRLGAQAPAARIAGIAAALRGKR